MDRERTQTNKGDGGALFRESLLHDGVVFPGAYVAKGLTLTRAGRKNDQSRPTLRMTRDCEEMALAYARILRRPAKSVQMDATFKANFWADWVAALEPSQRQAAQSTTPDDWDFPALLLRAEELDVKSSKRPRGSTSIGQVIEIDGKRLPAPRGFVVDSPGIFVSHSPKSDVRGRIRWRLSASDVTLNRTGPLHPGAARWAGRVINDPSVGWLASWKDPVTGKRKYVYPDRASSAQTMGRELAKFEAARAYGGRRQELLRRAHDDLTSPDGSPALRQCAACFCLLDTFAIRPGHDRDGLTRGLVTLRVENVRLSPKASTVTLDFIGKDSLRFFATCVVDPQLHRSLRAAMDGKAQRQLVFSDITASAFNAYLDSLQQGLTAKVIRTFHASGAFERALRLGAGKLRVIRDPDSRRRIAARIFQVAAVRAAATCNHQRATQRCAPALDPKSTFDKDQGIDVIAGRLDKHIRDAHHATATEPPALELGCWAPTTTLSNYIDPRIVVAYCDGHELRLSDVVSPAVARRMAWAARGSGTKAARSKFEFVAIGT